ncbi:Prolyl endopeptidase-like, partial [Acipenser ruthenus]
CVLTLTVPGQGEPQVLLSLGDVAWPDPEGASFQRVRLSPQEKHLAATVRSGRSEEASCAVVRLGSTPAVTHIQTAVFSFEWATDNILFYTSQKNLRSFQVYSLVFGEEQPQRTLVCEEQDPRFFVEVMSSKDKRFLTINCNSKSCSEVHLIECRSPLLPPVLVQPRTAGLIYHVEHSEGQLYILTNVGPAHEYQLMRAPLSSPSLKHWQLLYRPAVNTRVIDMELFEKHCVMAMRGRTQLYLDIIPLDEPAQVSTVKSACCAVLSIGAFVTLCMCVHCFYSFIADASLSSQLPQWACALEPGLNSQLSSNTFHFLLSSPAQPPRAFFYSLHENHLYQQQEEQAVACRTDYQTSRIEAQSMDGTAVPMTVIHRRTVEELCQSPLLVHVYGAYGVDLNMAFKPESRVLLDEGWTLAYCHVRGGGELGLGWHAQGRLTQKHRGLEDLQACVLRLFELGVSRPGLSALTGSSAGGVLAGALCNRSPELLRALILQAPFLDVLGAMQDPSLPLTVEEQEEWGDPLTNQEHRESIESYCPSHNIRAQRYPSMLITAYEGDQRVPLPGLLKYISRLRAAAAMHASEYNKIDWTLIQSSENLSVERSSDHGRQLRTRQQSPGSPMKVTDPAEGPTVNSSYAMNLCLSLITQGLEDTAFQLLKTFPTLHPENRDTPDLGNFFLRHCVNMDKVRSQDVATMAKALDPSYLSQCKADVLGILKEMKEKGVAVRDANVTSFFHILNALAMCAEEEVVWSLLDALFTMGLTEPSANLCSPLVTVHLEKGDLPTALEASMDCQRKYSQMPRLHDVLCKMVEKGETELLQKAMDFISQERGELTMLYDLFFAFMHTGKYKEARKIIETPGLRSRPGRLQWFSEKCIAANQGRVQSSEGCLVERPVRVRRVTLLFLQVETLENMVEMTRKLFECDRDEMYYCLIRLCKENNDLRKAEATWMKMQEENIIPRERTLRLLSDILMSSGQEVPFEVPEAWFEEAVEMEKTKGKAACPPASLPADSPVDYQRRIMTLCKKNMSGVSTMAERLANHFAVYRPATDLFLLFLDTGRTEDAKFLLQRCAGVGEQKEILVAYITRAAQKPDQAPKIKALLDILPDFPEKEMAYAYLMKCYGLDNDIAAAKALYQQKQEEHMQPDELCLKRLVLLLKSAGEPVPFTEPPESFRFYADKLRRGSSNQLSEDD